MKGQIISPSLVCVCTCLGVLEWSKLSYHEKRPSYVCMAVSLKTVLRATKHHRSLVRIMKSRVLQ